MLSVINVGARCLKPPKGQKGQKEKRRSKDYKPSCLSLHDLPPRAMRFFICIDLLVSFQILIDELISVQVSLTGGLPFLHSQEH
jgi:hypothetical protein